MQQIISTHFCSCNFENKNLHIGTVVLLFNALDASTNGPIGGGSREAKLGVERQFT